jgi:hypothetical protein
MGSFLLARLKAIVMDMLFGRNLLPSGPRWIRRCNKADLVDTAGGTQAWVRATLLRIASQLC